MPKRKITKFNRCVQKKLEGKTFNTKTKQVQAFKKATKACSQNFRKPFKPMPDSFHLPIETAVYVPSTKEKDKPISKKEYAKRVTQTRKKLSNMLGGYTSVKAVGGFTDEKGKVIEEPITKVTAFATKDAYNKNRKEYASFLKKKKKDWKQESIGMEYEGDLYYF